jgi:hypothetical protein
MKTQIKLTLLLLITTAVSIVGQLQTNYTAVQAAKHIGENATVTGKVDVVQ